MKIYLYLYVFVFMGFIFSKSIHYKTKNNHPLTYLSPLFAFMTADMIIGIVVLKVSNPHYFCYCLLTTHFDFYQLVCNKILHVSILCSECFSTLSFLWFCVCVCVGGMCSKLVLNLICEAQTSRHSLMTGCDRVFVPKLTPASLLYVFTQETHMVYIH
jgi:hypothetical protein